MSFLNLFRRKPPSYRPVNAIEQILDRDEDKFDPRAFISLLASRPLLTLGDFGGERDVLRLQTTKGVDQSNLAFAFTSQEAVAWYLGMNTLGPQSVITMKGQDLFKMLADADYGVILNSGINKGRVMLPKNARYVLSLMNGSAPEAQPERLDRPGSFTLALPAKTPIVLVHAISHYMRNHQEPAEALLALRSIEGEDQITWAVYLPAATGNMVQAEDRIKSLGAVIAEVQDPDRNDLPLDITVVDQAHFDELRRAAILITKDGHRDPATN